MKQYYVYILTNYSDMVFYVGVTNDLVRRIYEHRNGLIDGFTKKYKVHKLVYFENYDDVNLAIEREKCLKDWRREKKRDLISSVNSEYNDLYDDIIK